MRPKDFKMICRSRGTVPTHRHYTVRHLHAVGCRKFD